MKLKKLILNNYKQHAHREITFEGNIIGVIGPNGSGKSNLLGAIHFALAGEQPGCNKVDLLRWGEVEGSVELYFEHNGMECQITRALQSTSVYLKYGNEETTGIRKVEERMSTLMGMDKDLLKQAIFVRQAEIDAILFTDPRVRELSFQKLCGIGDAAKIHKKLGDELAEMATPPDYDEQIAEAQKRHKETKDRSDTLVSQMAQMQSTLAMCATFEALQQTKTTQDQISYTLRTMVELEHNKAAIELAIQRDEAALAAVVIPDADVTELDKQITSLQDLMKQSETYHRALKSFEESGKAVMALGKAPSPAELVFSETAIADLKKAADDLQAKFNAVKAEVQLYEGLKKAVEGKLSTGAECPICGNPVTDTDRLIRKLQACQSAYTALQSEGMVNTMAYETARLKNGEVLSAAERKMAAYHAQYTVLMQQYKQAETILDSTKKIDADMGDMCSKLAYLTELRKAVLSGSSIRTTLTAQIKTNKDYLANIVTNLSASMDRVTVDPMVAKNIKEYGLRAALTNVDSRIATLITNISEVQKLNQQLAQLSGMSGELEKILKELSDTISKLEFKRSQQDEYRKATKILSDVRDWFHYANGPHTLASSVLADMVKDINTFLEEFSSPFTVISSDDAMGFKYIMHDGSVMPDSPPDATHLSGGQRIQLAIAFRFAAYCMFASKLGILSLDEPAAYLDDYHLGRLCALLEKVKQVAKKMDLQILLATHEKEIMSFCDTLVDLNNTQEVISTSEGKQ